MMSGGIRTVVIPLDPPHEHLRLLSQVTRKREYPDILGTVDIGLELSLIPKDSNHLGSHVRFGSCGSQIINVIPINVQFTEVHNPHRPTQWSVTQSSNT